MIPATTSDTSTEVFTDSASDTSTWSVSLLPYGRHNLLLPSFVAADVVRRRLWVLGADMTLAEVDLDGGTLIDVHRMELGFEPTALGVDGRGVVWIACGTGVVRFDPRDDSVTTLRPPDVNAVGLVALPSGGIVVTGTTPEGDGGVVTLLGEDGALMVRRLFAGTIGAPALTPTGALALPWGPDGTDPVIVLLSLPDLATETACPAPWVATVVTALSDGALVAASETELVRVDCAAQTWTSVVSGEHNRGLVGLGDQVVALDQGSSLATSIGRTFDASLTLQATFLTAPHAVNGAFDPISRRVWVSGEDAAVVRALTPAGDALVDTRLGEHVESIAPDPGRPGRYHFTGRLTGTAGWIDLPTGRRALVRGVGVWPTQPVRVGDRLWVLDQADTRLHALDPETLVTVATVDIGRPNALRVFGDLAWHAGRRTLFLTDSAANALVEIDPVSGEELAAWDLAGAPVENAGVVGRAELVLGDDEAWVARSSDGTVSRVSFDEATYTHTNDVGDPEGEGALQAVWLGDGVLMVGGIALDADTLERLPDADLPVDLVIARLEGGWLGWRDVPATLVALDEDGDEVGAQVVTDEWRRPELAWDADAERVVWTSFLSAGVSSAFLGDWIVDLGIGG